MGRVQRVGNTLAELRKAREPKRFSVATTFAVRASSRQVKAGSRRRGWQDCCPRRV